MNTLESILAEQTFFNGLEPRYLQLIAGCASNARFAADHYIFHEGEAGLCTKSTSIQEAGTPATLQRKACLWR